MSWTVGQRVAIQGGYVHENNTHPRATVSKVYKDGGCSLDDGSRWTRSGHHYGKGYSREYLRPAEDVEAAEDENRLLRRMMHARLDIVAAAKSVTDIAILERALAVLRGEP